MEDSPAATRVLVIGAAGMLGHAVCRGLADAGMHVLRSQRKAPDQAGYVDAQSAAVETQLECVFADMRPEYVVNCAGVLKNEMDNGGSAAVLRGIYVNAAFPHVLTAQAARANIRIIHMSTDG